MNISKRYRGNNPVTTASSNSGIWTPSEIAGIKRNQPNQATNATFTAINDNWQTGGDPYWPDVALLVTGSPHTDNGMYDLSGNQHDAYIIQPNHTWPIVAPYNNGPKHYFSTDLYSDYYQFNDTAALRFNDGPFTIEAWVYPRRNDATEVYIMGKGGNAARTSGTGWVVYQSTDYKIGIYDANSNVSLLGATALSRDTWHHIAIVRSSTAANSTRIYINGVLDATGTIAGNFNQTNNLIIGRDRVVTAATWYGGLICDIRLMTSAVYTANFSVPTAPLDMTGAIFSLSANDPWHPPSNFTGAWQQQNLTMSYYTSFMTRIPMSPYRDLSTFPYGTVGTNSCLLYEGRWFRIKDHTYGDTNKLNFGTGPFTVECWVRTSDVRLNSGICGKGTGNIGSGTGWSAYLDPEGDPSWSDGNNTLAGSTLRVAHNAWYHVAFVRENTGTNGFKIYLNGYLAHTGTVATDYSNVSEDLNMFATRNVQYSSSNTAISCLKISKVARYTAPFTVNNGSFIDTMCTVDADTSLLTCTANVSRVVGPVPGAANEGHDINGAVLRWNHFYAGNQVGQARADLAEGYGGHSFRFTTGGNNKVLCTTVNSDFSFGDGDFSIEFWYAAQNSVRDGANNQVFFDTRSNFNDSGICLTSGELSGFEVQAGNQVRLTTDDTTYRVPNKWTHICVQRVGEAMALYVDGRLRAECKYPDVINSPGNKIYIGNGSYQNIRWSSGIYGWISNFRIEKGRAAYGFYGQEIGNGNPSSFRVPTSPLRPTEYTTLLTACGPQFTDYSGRNNLVGSGGLQSLQENITTSWNVFVHGHSPFSPESDFDPDPVVMGDTQASSSGFYWADGGEGRYYGSRSSTWAWIPRMSRPWTIEIWFQGSETNPGAPSNICVIRTANGTNHVGFELYYHLNNAAASSRNDVYFRIWKGTGGTQGFGSTGNTGNIKPHGLNHVAVVYDPTKTNQVAIFCNGLRVAVGSLTGMTAVGYIAQTNGLDTPASGIYDMRISTVPRYDNDVIPYTLPTSAWQYDSSTFYLAKHRSPLYDVTNRNMYYMYGANADFYYKKWNRPSVALLNDDARTTHTARFGFTEGNWNVFNRDIRLADFTIECWASWWDVAAKGKAFGTNTEGSVLWHLGNSLWCGVDPNGYWQVLIKNANSTLYDTWKSDVLVGTKTEGRWDHVALCRSGRNIIFYVNGVEKAIMRTNGQGTFTNGPAYNHQWDIVQPNWHALIIGSDNSSLQATKWAGWVDDFRMTHAARYETRMISGIPTMCHKGTEHPALPQGPFPTR